MEDKETHEVANDKDEGNADFRPKLSTFLLLLALWSFVFAEQVLGSLGETFSTEIKEPADSNGSTDTSTGCKNEKQTDHN